MAKKFTQLFPKDLTYDRSSREKKAKKIVAILMDYCGDLSNLSCLDLGCSLGYISNYLARYFKRVDGVDVDRFAVAKARTLNKRKNLSFYVSSENKIPFKDKSFDVVIFNQIYEHAQNPTKVIKEIQRILKNRGVCFFGARNKLGIFDGHYSLPFIAWLPRFIADWYVKKKTGKKSYDVKLYSQAELKRLTRNFMIIDYTLRVINDPVKFRAQDTVPTKFGLNKLIWVASRVLYNFVPNYLWLLRKK